MRKTIRSLFTVLMALFSLSHLQAEPLEIEFKISNGSQGQPTLLPTPVRILAEANFEVLIRTGYGKANQYSNFRPLASIVDGAEETQDDFQKIYDVPPQETEADKNKRLNRVLENRRTHVLENGKKLKVDLPRDRDFFVELGGARPLFTVRETSVRKFRFAESSPNKIQITVPVIEFPSSEREASVRYRLYKFIPSLVARAPDSIPSAYANRADEYFKQIVYREENNRLIAGSTDSTQAPRRGYILSTCIEFRDMNGPVKVPTLDFSSQCWIYDLKQMNEVLPVTGEDHSRARTYLVVREATDLEGKAKAKVYAMADSYRASYIKLPEVSEWKKF